MANACKTNTCAVFNPREEASRPFGSPVVNTIEVRLLRTTAAWVRVGTLRQLFLGLEVLKPRSGEII